jgi:hypothetical protein
MAEDGSCAVIQRFPPCGKTIWLRSATVLVGHDGKVPLTKTA